MEGLIVFDPTNSLAPTNNLGNYEGTTPGSSLRTFKQYDRCRPVFSSNAEVSQRISEFREMFLALLRILRIATTVRKQLMRYGH